MGRYIVIGVIELDEAAESCTIDGESPVIENFIWFIQNRINSWRLIRFVETSLFFFLYFSFFLLNRIFNQRGSVEE